MLLIGGVPSIYYGQEIGMMGKNGSWDNTDGNDIHRRTAFKWGKSYSEKGMATWYKNIPGAWNNSNLNVNDDISLEAQLGDSSSLFHHYKKMIQLKQSNAALAQGNYVNAINNNNKIFSFYRNYKNIKVLIVVNLSNETQTASFENQYSKFKSLYGKAVFNQNELKLSPYELAVFEVR
jgi:glycosidase